ncbi:MAG: hypothetical protein AAGC55_27300, partial [Myxococcota bacterium]
TKRGYYLKEYEEKGLDWAVYELRDGLNVRAYRNYFLFALRDVATERSVRVMLEYTDGDPVFAYGLVTSLADIITDNESSRRLKEMKVLADGARAKLNRAEAKYAQLKQELNEANFEYLRGEVTGDAAVMSMARVALNSLSRKIKEHKAVLEMERAISRQWEFRLTLEENNMGVIWEVVSEKEPEVLPPPGPIKLAVVGFVAFCFLVPICAIGFGTLDSKIHEPDDVSRLGIPVLGHIHSFEGDKVGSLKDRGAFKGRGFFARFTKNRRLRDNRIA